MVGGIRGGMVAPIVAIVVVAIVTAGCSTRASDSAPPTPSVVESPAIVGVKHLCQVHDDFATLLAEPHNATLLDRVLSKVPPDATRSAIYISVIESTFSARTSAVSITVVAERKHSLLFATTLDHTRMGDILAESTFEPWFLLDGIMSGELLITDDAKTGRRRRGDPQAHIMYQRACKADFEQVFVVAQRNAEPYIPFDGKDSHDGFKHGASILIDGKEVLLSQSLAVHKGIVSLWMKLHRGLSEPDPPLPVMD